MFICKVMLHASMCVCACVYVYVRKRRKIGKNGRTEYSYFHWSWRFRAWGWGWHRGQRNAGTTAQKRQMSLCCLKSKMFASPRIIQKYYHRTQSFWFSCRQSVADEHDLVFRRLPSGYDHSGPKLVADDTWSDYIISRCQSIKPCIFQILVGTKTENYKHLKHKMSRTGSSLTVEYCIKAMSN